MSKYYTRCSYVVTKVYYGFKNSFGSGVTRWFVLQRSTAAGPRSGFQSSAGPCVLYEDGRHMLLPLWMPGPVTASPHRTGTAAGRGRLLWPLPHLPPLTLQSVGTRNRVRNWTQIPTWTQAPRLVVLLLKQYTMYHGAPPCEESWALLRVIITYRGSH